ncbi:RagB/SusD family nutrient uptake outer membrane protein [Mucilaginibacter calamicampi]|uniref:RagB/SusD family nutrient uptake outer membrane protein n=1 Tax=Mucilaginibacter calamicampi TaxID=1302352 RepID=A0ABW2YUJ4_9SPHI
MKNFIILLLITCMLLNVACKRMLDVPTPQNQLTTDKVFSDSVSVKSALFSVYAGLENQQYPLSNRYLSAYTDESMISGVDQSWNQSRLSAGEVANTGNWSNLYTAVYQCNMILEQLGPGNILPESFKRQVRAEAKFLRGYCYFYLINLYGSVPLITVTDVNLSSKAVQSDSAAVYAQVLTDLNSAHEELSVAYPGTGRIRANKACAAALLARVFLYQRNWAGAENRATEVLNTGMYTPLDNITGAFKATGKEGILQLGSQNGCTTEAGTVIPSFATVAAGYYLTDNFYASFAPGDLRKSNWIGTSATTVSGLTTTYRYPYKYKNRVANTTAPENLMILRAAEQYLIRAEARASLGKLNGAGSAAEDLNVVRQRAGLPAVQFIAQHDALESIADERKHELFFENCDRFLDMKRTGRLQTIMTAAKATWQPTGARLPIPLTDITRNPNLIQNAGY